ncbi:hypothetical protein AAHE18_19G209900 [Arachis hypogaea]
MVRNANLTAKSLPKSTMIYENLLVEFLFVKLAFSNIVAIAICKVCCKFNASNVKHLLYIHTQELSIVKQENHILVIFFYHQYEEKASKLACYKMKMKQIDQCCLH